MPSERAKEWRENARAAMAAFGGACSHSGKYLGTAFANPDAYLRAREQLEAILDEPLSWGSVHLLPATRSELPPLEWDD